MDFCDRGEADAPRFEAAGVKDGACVFALAGWSRVEVWGFGVKARVVAAMSVDVCVVWAE